jgi:polar amino acid transport system substrate-binding protein
VRNVIKSSGTLKQLVSSGDLNFHKEGSMKKIIMLSLSFLSTLLGTGAQTPTLRTAYENVAPKFMKDTTGNFYGLCVELMNAISADTGIIFSAPSDFIPKARYEAALAAGVQDVQFGLRKDAQREALFIFGEPLYTVQYILVTTASDNVPVTNLDDLTKLAAGKRILTVYQAASVRFLQNLGFDVDDGGRDVASNLEKLVAGRGHYFIFQNLSTVFELNKSPLKNQLKILPVDLESYYHHVVYSKNLSPQIRQRVEDSIRNLKANGTWASILSKYF